MTAKLSKRNLRGITETLTAGRLTRGITLPAGSLIKVVFAQFLIACYDKRNAGTWSRNARIANLKEMPRAVNYLTERNTATLEELKAFADALGNEVDALRDSMKAKASL